MNHEPGTGGTTIDLTLAYKMHKWATAMRYEIDAFVEHAMTVEPEKYVNEERTLESLTCEFVDNVHYHGVGGGHPGGIFILADSVEVSDLPASGGSGGSG